MSKKIIAILLVFTLVITCFVACQKQKLDTVTVNGEEVALVTDDEGNTIVNDDNQVAVLVTDFDGEIVEYENGEPQTRWVEVGNGFVGDDYVMGRNYKFSIIEGWSASSSGKVVKDGTDGNCYIKFNTIMDADDNDNFKIYLDQIDAQNESLVALFAEKGYNLEIERSQTTVTDKDLFCEIYIYKIVDDAGEVIHYAENHYFVAGTTIYSIDYACENGVGYDETFNFANYIKENFIFND